MRIFSKFHDYYDTALGYGIDPKIIYRRIEEQKKIGHLSYRARELYGLKSEYPIIEKYYDRIRYGSDCFKKFEIKGTFLLLFCGKLYGGLKISVDHIDHTVEDFIYVYSIKELDQLFKLYASKKEQEDYFKKKRNFFYSHSRIQYENFFEGILGKNIEELNQIHFDTGIPVIKFERDMITFNPILKDLQFFKVVDPFAAFQELSMFIGGVMGGESPPMIQISDEIRAHKHGFDKMSFRKGPTSKRKKR